MHGDTGAAHGLGRSFVVTALLGCRALGHVAVSVILTPGIKCEPKILRDSKDLFLSTFLVLALLLHLTSPHVFLHAIGLVASVVISVPVGVFVSVGIGVVTDDIASSVILVSTTLEHALSDGDVVFLSSS